MYLAYSLLLALGLIVLIPHFLFQALVHGKYVAGLRQRFGGLIGLPNGSKPVIWLHCVSVGETQAARPLVVRLKTEFPHHSLVVSTTTMTGQRLAQDIFRQQADAVFYFPFDWRWSVRRTLREVNPVAVLIMETELWPNFLRECKQRDIPVALVNGRISRQSFRRYNLIKIFLRRILSCLNLAVMQSTRDADRIRALGLSTDKLFVSGNLKFDVETTHSTTAKTKELGDRFGLLTGGSLILAASTHAPEEKIILESFQELVRANVGQPPVRLMLAPRHPERFQEVASLSQGFNLTWARRTEPSKATDSTADVILLDTIGELTATFDLAEIVFVGGSIIDRGGHNVLEPAAVGACVVTGAHTDNFHAIVQLLTEADALVQLPPLEGREMTAALTEVLRRLLAEPARRAELGQNAKQLVVDNQGATEKTIQLIKPLILKEEFERRALNRTLVTDTHLS